MKIRLLGSSVQHPAHRQYATSDLINGPVGIDAGSTGFHDTPHEQEAVEHVFLTALPHRSHRPPDHLRRKRVDSRRGESDDPRKPRNPPRGAKAHP